MGGVMSAEDLKTAKEVVQREQSKTQNLEEFRMELNRHRATAMSSRGASGCGGGGAGGRRLSQEWKGLAQITPGNPSQPEANMLKPPESHIWRGNLGTGSWQIHCPPYPRRSIPWSIAGGGREACRRVLEYAWRLHLQDNGQTEQDCLVQGIFGQQQPGQSSSSCA